MLHIYMAICSYIYMNLIIYTICIAGGFWAVILSLAAWKRSWAGCDPTHSIIVADRSVAIIGDAAWAQLLIA